jgi:hypothetical protein
LGNAFKQKPVLSNGQVFLGRSAGVVESCVACACTALADGPKKFLRATDGDGTIWPQEFEFECVYSKLPLKTVVKEKHTREVVYCLLRSVRPMLIAAAGAGAGQDWSWRYPDIPHKLNPIFSY